MSTYMQTIHIQWVSHVWDTRTILHTYTHDTHTAGRTTPPAYRPCPYLVLSLSWTLCLQYLTIGLSVFNMYVSHLHMWPESESDPLPAVSEDLDLCMYMILIWIWCVCMCMYVCLYVCSVCVCIHVHTHMHIYTYIYIYINIHTYQGILLDMYQSKKMLMRDWW